MKKYFKLLCLVLVLATVLSLTACAGKTINVVEYDGWTFSSGMFHFALAEIKGNIVALYKQGQSVDISSEASFWNSAVSEDDERTKSQFVIDETIKMCKTLILSNKLCKDLGIEVTDEEALQQIEDAITEMSDAQGGEDLMAIFLAKYGITTNELREYYLSKKRMVMLRDYYFGSEGSMKIPQSTVEEKFLSEYVKLDALGFNYYTTNEDGENIAIIFDDITTEETIEYFTENYVKVKHILYMTVDANRDPLSEEEIAEAEDKANATYNAIINGEVDYDDKLEENQDGNDSYIFTYGDMVEEFEEAAFDMEIDEVRMVKTFYGYHIIKKIEYTDEDIEEYKEDCKIALSRKRIDANVEALLKEFESGDKKIEDYFDEDKAEAEEYWFQADFIMTGDKETATGLELFLLTQPAGYSTYGDSGGLYLLRHMEITLDDLSDGYYSEIESPLIDAAFDEYLTTFYDSFNVDMEEINKYDPLLVNHVEVYYSV